MVRGRVVDATTGAPVAGATVAAGSQSAVSAADGSFALIGVAGGHLELFTYAPGYLPATIDVPATARHAARIALSSELLSDDEIAVELGADGETIVVSGEAPDLGRDTTYELTPAQIRGLPGAGNDVLRAVQSLPGAARIAYGIGGLVLRGADSNDTKVYVDGIEAPLAFHFGGLSSVVPSTLIERLQVTPSGGDVVRGRGVGGVVEIQTRPGRRDRWRAGGELSFLDGAAFAEGPVAGGGVSLGLRRSYAGEIIDAVAPSEYRFLPRYLDGQLRWDRALAGGTLTALAFFSDDRITRGDDADLQQRFARAGLRYTRRIGGNQLGLLAWAGWRDFLIDADSELTLDQESDVYWQQGMVPFGARADLRRDLSWGHVAAGVDLETTRYGETTSADPEAPSGRLVEPPHATSQLGAWAEARWRIADGKLTLKPGVRVDHFSASQAWVVEPRLAVSHQLARWLTLREGLSVHHQPPSPLNIVDDEGLRAVVAPARGVHASIGAEVRLPGGVDGIVTAYRNQAEGPRMPSDALFGLSRITGLGVAGENLVGNELGNDGGRARSRGVEVSARAERGRWLLWLAYTLSRSERHTGSEAGARWQVASIDQTHNANAVASVQLGAWRAGARLRYATGFPDFSHDVVLDEDGEMKRIDFTYRGRLRDFVSLDVRVERAWQRPWGTVAVFLDVQNATNRENQEGTMQDTDGSATRLQGLPVFPTFGLSLLPPAP